MFAAIVVCYFDVKNKNWGSLFKLFDINWLHLKWRETVSNNYYKERLDILFSQDVRRKCVARARREIVQELFGPTTDPQKRLEIYTYLLRATAGRLPVNDRNYFLNQAKELFHDLTVLSLDNNDLNLLAVSFVQTDEMPEAMRLVYQLAASTFFLYVGASPQETRRFCQILFDQIKKVVELCAPLSKEEVPGAILEFLIFLARVALQSAIAPYDGRCPQKLWFINLIKICHEGDEQAIQWLEGLVEFLCAKNRDLVVTTDYPSAVADETESEQNAQHIVVPGECFAPFKKMIGEIKAKRIAIGHKAAAFKRWYMVNREAVRRSFDLKCREIRDEATRLLYTDGTDQVEVKLSALYDIGIRSFTFYEAKTSLPDVRLLLKVRKDMCILCDFQASLEGLVLQAENYVFDNFTESDYGYLREILTYVVVDAMHAIMVRNVEFSHNKKCHVGKANGDGHYIVRTIRPQLRKLPPNCQASQEACARAAAKGWSIPSGRTFVKEHDCPFPISQGGPSVDSPKVVCSSYTDEAFQRSIK